MSRALIEKSKWIVKQLQEKLNSKLDHDVDFNLLFKQLEILLEVNMSSSVKQESYLNYHRIVIVGTHEKLDKNRIQKDLKNHFETNRDIDLKWVSFKETKNFYFRNLINDGRTTDLIIENRDHQIKDNKGLQLLLNRPSDDQLKILDYKDYMQGTEKKLSNTGIITYICEDSNFNFQYKTISIEGEEFD